MSRLAPTFARLAAAGERALIPYITAGDGGLETTRRAVLAMARAGADIVELGVPFSDPVADGPTIQAAASRALQGGIRTRDIFRAVSELRQETDTPIVLLVYYNCIFRFGEDAFVEQAAACGVDGLIVPDLPPEEGESLLRAGEEAGVDVVWLLAPTSTGERIRLVAQRARGFIYCVSLTGVTGAREHLAAGLADLVARIRPHTSVPLAVGFGISTSEQARAVASLADGVIVGSALINRMTAAGSQAAAVEAAARFVAELKDGMRQLPVARLAP